MDKWFTPGRERAAHITPGAFPADRSRSRPLAWATRLCVHALAAAVLISATSGADDESDLKLPEVVVGIDGNFQVGRWTRISGSVASKTWPVDVVVRVPDPDGNLTRFPMGKISGPESGSASFDGIFKTGRLDGVIRVDLETQEGARTHVLRADVASAEDPESPLHVWTQGTQLWGVLGDAAGFEGAVKRIAKRSTENRLPVKLIKLAQASELPTQQEALQSLRVLVVNGAVPIPEAVSLAIERWVIGGGHLVVAVGDTPEYAESPLSQWIPIRTAGQSRLRNLSYLTMQVPGSAAIRDSVVDAVRFDVDFGETVAATLDGPLWARVPHGFGRVTFLGVGLSDRPLVGWESLPMLCERLADSPESTVASQQRTAASQLSQTGVSDLQTQLATGLDLFPGISLPTSWTVMGLMLLLLIVVGPLDYLLVHKILRRPRWTWVTFPLLVIAGAGAAVGAARQQLPAKPLANQVDVVDIDAASNSMRVRSLVSFTCSDSARYRVSADLSSSAGMVAGDMEDSLRVCWTGVPESGFRGMHRAGGLELAKPTYSFSPQRNALIDLPATERSSVGVTAAWIGNCQSPDDVVVADLRNDVGRLTGTITNRMDVSLQDWFVAYEGRVYVPETRRGGEAATTIQPGETLDLTDHRRAVARVLKHFFVGLRNFRVKRDDSKHEDVTAERDVYDPLSRDAYLIWRMVSFYRACDGGEFTSLANQSLESFDLSPLLPLDRAVLFCRTDGPVATFSVDDEPLEATEQTTILRILLPVHRR